MNFTDVILKTLPDLPMSDVLRIKNAIDLTLGPDSMAAIAKGIKKEKGLLPSVKYVKEVTGWSLIDSKNYCDQLIIN